MATRRYRRSRSSIWVSLAVIAAVALAYALSTGQWLGGTGASTAVPVNPTAPATGASTPVTVDAAASLAQLDALTVDDQYVGGYERSEFGSGWKDPDGNGCDARNDILARDLSDPTFKPGTADCVVLTGTLDDPYTGTRIDFERGNTTSELVQIDHIVPLSWSWPHGASTWSDDERLQFANDPSNLRAVDGPTNGSKSDSGPGEWMPPDAAFACTYVEGFIAVLSAYRLSIDQADSDAIRRVLAGC